MPICKNKFQLNLSSKYEQQSFTHLEKYVKTVLLWFGSKGIGVKNKLYWEKSYNIIANNSCSTTNSTHIIIKNSGEDREESKLGIQSINPQHFINDSHKSVRKTGNKIENWAKSVSGKERPMHVRKDEKTTLFVTKEMLFQTIRWYSTHELLVTLSIVA